MKRITYTLGLLLAGSVALAQTFTFDPGDVLDYELTPGEDLQTAQIDIINNTEDDLLVGWERIDNSLLQNWECTMCSYGTCLENIPESGQFISPLPAGGKGFIKVWVVPYEFEGAGTVRFAVFDANNTTDRDTITFNITLGTIGVEELELDENVQLFPNPATDVVTFQNKHMQDLNVQVFSVVGKEVANVFVSAQTAAELNTTTWNAGIYYVSYNTAQGRKTKRLVVKH